MMISVIPRHVHAHVEVDKQINCVLNEIRTQIIQNIKETYLFLHFTLSNINLLAFSFLCF